MLLDNFKSLLSFTQNMNFVNVLGNTVSKSKVLQGCGLYNGSQGSNNTVVNGHSRYGTTCFNYNATTTANGFKNEQTTYHWNNVVCCTTESTSTNNEGSTNRRQNGFTLFVGNGTAEPKADDYKLESPLILNVSQSSCIELNNNKITVSRSFINNTEEDATVSEIGCYLFATNTWSNSVNSSEYIPIVMIGRKVLKNPVPILTGELYTFNYTIDMSQIAFLEADS